MQKVDCVVITGAGQGIGKAVALDMGGRGSHILCISKSENAKRTARDIVSAGGSAESIMADIGQLEATGECIARWVKNKNFQRMGLVLAASCLGPQNYQDLAGWEECYRVNLLGNVAVYSGLRSTLLANKFGRIVGFGGGGAAYAYPLFPAYAASKAATVRALENIQEDLKAKGNFAVVCLAPGANNTAMLQQVRAAGAEVRTTVDISEPVTFVREFLMCESCGFGGAFVHVRDNWRDYLNGPQVDEKKWKLRRIET